MNAAKPDSSEKPELTPEEKLAQNEILAEMINLSYGLDLDYLADQVRDFDHALAIECIVNPGEWFAHNKEWRAMSRITQAGIEFANVARAVRAPKAKENERPV